MSTLSIVTRSSQAESQITEFRQSASSASQSAENADYGFIALLGLAQRLRVDILPLTWQAARGSLEEDGKGGRGGQAKIYQSYINPGASFVFKRFSRNAYHELVSELLVLTHEVVRKHRYIVHLEGLCWDVRDDDDVRPVLVFEKSPLGDLYYFMKTGLGKELSINDRLRLCIEIGVAIRDMHANNIIHGDIKPRNILIFETRPSRYTAKIGDFGFSTRFRGKGDLIYMPRSRIWHAPEWHDRAFRPEDTKRMDIFSFGMVCLWMLFGVDLPLDSTGDNRQLISFEEDCDPATNCLEMWKTDDEKDELTTWAISIIPESIGPKRNDITSLFKSALAKVPQKRELGMDGLLQLLDPARYVWGRRIDVSRLLSPLAPARNLPKVKTFIIETAPTEEHFEIPTLFSQLFLTDFRIPPFIVAELKFATAQSQRFHRISPQKAALQLALSHATGFGVPQDEELALQVLLQHKLDWTDLESQVRAVREHENDGFEGSLFSKLGRRGFTPEINFAQYYHERNLLERARIVCERDLLAVERLFHRQHHIYRRKKADLSRIFMSQNRWKEAEQLLTQLVELTTGALGPEHPSTLIIKGLLARAYREQGYLMRAQELDVHVFEKMVRILGPEDPHTVASSASLMSTNWKRRGLAQTIEGMMQILKTYKRLLGPEHQSTLSSMVDLGSAYRDQGELMKAEELFMQVVQTTERVLGEEHPDTLTSMDHLASTYRKQGRQKQAEELEMQVLKKRKRGIGEEHPDTLNTMTHLAVTYRGQGRLREAADLFEQVMKIRKKVLGLDHEDTLAVMAYLALTYRDQGQDRWTQAEDLFVQAIKTSRRVLGEEHLSTLVVMNNLAGMYWGQKRWTEAEELYLQELEARKKVLGGEHSDTLTCMENLGWVYRKQGRREEAKKLFFQVLETRSRVLGPENPATLSSKVDLEWA